jgi:hypothetical protein
MPEIKDWWGEVSPLLDEAMELPLAARESWLADLERQVWVFLSRLKQHGALPGATADQAFFVRTSAALDPSEARDIRIALRVGFAARAPNEFLTYDFRYLAATLTTVVRPVRDAERHLG